MFTFLAIITTITFFLLILVASMQPLPNVVSISELTRRAKRGTKEAKTTLRREQYLPDVVALLRVKIAILLVVFVLLSVVTFGWLVGTIVAIVIAFEYGAIARISVWHRLSQNLYTRLEPHVIAIAERYPILFSFIRSLPSYSSKADHRIDSREELQQLIDDAGDVISDNERTLIVHALGFNQQRVDSVMTPKSVIDSIKKTEFLGPLVLSELHDLGHSRLPVIGSDIHHVVGVLHLKNLLSLDIKNSVTAEKAMEAKVFYIHQEESLEHALAAFLKTHHHLFIVINDDRETVGLLTLEDVMEALLGRKILDEDDNHEDLRAIATRIALDNNSPENHTDV
ncbi:MAG: CBS domain-containing protein [Candidatus Saccharimonadales bacterium]